jgi:hypothetical protein
MSKHITNKESVGSLSGHVWDRHPFNKLNIIASKYTATKHPRLYSEGQNIVSKARLESAESKVTVRKSLEIPEDGDK